MLFISHAKEDNSRALKVRDWLREQGWKDVFLDIDPNSGIAPGQRWQEELKRAGERCDAVVVLVSPAWLASRWCQTEFLVADQLGKKILPMIVESVSFDALPLELRAKFQLADISSPENESEGFQRFAIGLRRAGLDPTSFSWPPPNDPNRSVYRGLSALDIDDAAVFFGRSAAIVRVLDELRRMRDQGAKRLFVILGASGAGKSSFMRAGVLARLHREDRDFLVLPVMRPGATAMSGPGGLADTLAKAGAGGGPWVTSEAITQAFAKLRAPVVERRRAVAEAAGETYSAKPPTIVIPIDQAEELVAPETAEATAMLDLLAEAAQADANVIVLITIRTDGFEPLQRRWMPEHQQVFSLAPVAPSAFKEIIEGPAALAKPPIKLDPAMVDTILSDLSGADALPLLAFTLERLLLRCGQDQHLSLEDYRDGLGGLSGAIQTAVAEVLGTSPGAAITNNARRLFIPALVRVTPDGPTRRQADILEIPEDLRPLAEQFVKQRLLARNGSLLEITHEAILRHWPALASWIAEERVKLAALDTARAAAREWRAADDAPAWLVHRGARLAGAEAVASEPSYAAQAEPFVRDYLAACRAIETREARARLRLRAAVGAAVAFAGLLVVAWMNWSLIGPELKRVMLYAPYASSPARFAELEPGARFEDCRSAPDLCPEMVMVPPGVVLIGQAPIPGISEEELARIGFEPQRRVTIAKFAVSITEITFDQWQACVDAGGCRGQPNPTDRGWGRGARPVINVSAADGEEYARWLSRMSGGTYRLLSEAEWIYVAGASTEGTNEPWGLGVDQRHLAGFATFLENSGGRTAEVGSRRPNAFGLFDLNGNVYEWTRDCIPSEESDPCETRAFRGGSYANDARNVRTQTRLEDSQFLRRSSIGLRIARVE